MTVQVLKNAQGEIIAAFARTPGALVVVEAEPSDGDKVEAVENTESEGLDAGFGGLVREAFSPPTSQILRDASGRTVAAFDHSSNTLASVAAEPSEGEKLEGAGAEYQSSERNLIDLLRTSD